MRGAKKTFEWRSWGMVVALAVAGLLPRSVYANSATEIVALRQLWERAVAAEEQNDWASAERALSEAVGIKETPGLRYHLAHSREMQRKWVEALVDYKSVEEQIHAGASAPDVEPLLQAAIQRVEAKIPKLTIEIERAEGLSLYIDGQRTSVKLLGLPIALNPGGHRIAVTAPGFEAAIRNITLREAEQRTLPLSLSPASSVNRAEREPFSAKPYVLVAEAGVALAAAGFAVYHRTEATAARRQALDEFALEQDRFALGWAVGAGVFTAAFALTWILWSDDSTSTEHASSDHVSVDHARAHMAVGRARTARLRLSTDWSKVTLEGAF